MRTQRRKVNSGMFAIPLEQEQGEDSHIEAEIDFEAGMDAAIGGLEHVDADRAMIGDG